MIGVGAMIQSLGGNEETVAAVGAAIGQKIAKLSLDDDVLHFAFENGYRMNITDDGRSCCEYRYLSTDDDLAYHIGATLLDFELSAAEETSEEYGQVHEIVFLRVKTDRGVITVASHNEHNGYYGGIWLCAKALPEK